MSGSAASGRPPRRPRSGGAASAGSPPPLGSAAAASPPAWPNCAPWPPGLDYRLQATSKTREGSEHPDRNAQFEHINGEAERFQAAGQPVISVDTKKKELVGDFANGGREWQPNGEPERVRLHDFPDKELGKVSPYGVLDLAANVGWD